MTTTNTDNNSLTVTFRQARCCICDSAFLPHAPNQRTCSPPCSHELTNLRKARWKRKPSQPNSSCHDIPCARCSKTFTQKRRTMRFCSGACRVLFHRGFSYVSPEEAHRAVEDQRRKAVAFEERLHGVRDHMGTGQSGKVKNWWRADNAEPLEAVGLPPNYSVAAKVLGISVDTLRQRVRRGVPLLQPLRRDRRCGRLEPLPLTLPSVDAAHQFKIWQTTWQRKLAEFQHSL